MSSSIRFRILATVVALGVLLTICAPAHSDSDATKPGTQCFTAWDQYYFYAAFVVNDSHVNSTNTTPLSQPQQDDDVEVFFDTNGAHASSARLPGTYQMAVSAGDGAYFSVGSDSGKPLAKAVYTYKFATTVDGTLNNNSDTDLGYTVELAIPWQELGLTGPPAPGTTWGFNVINRDRSSIHTLADHLASLSPKVAGASDVQKPKQWTSITFTTLAVPVHSGPDGVFCPHLADTYPLIDGVVKSGEYYRPDGFSLPAPTIFAPAPSIADEPNVSAEESQQTAKALITTPVPTATPSQVPVPQPTPLPLPIPGGPTSGYEVPIPGGGTLHVGKLAPPQPPPDEIILPTPESGNDQTNQPTFGPSGKFKPLIPVVGPTIESNEALRLLEQPNVGQLTLALYESDFKQQDDLASSFPAGTFVDQPMSGAGSWFGGGSLQYQMDQAREARRSGIDVLLVRYSPSDASKSSLLTLVQALQALKASDQDYPLIAPYVFAAPGEEIAALDSFYKRVPKQFRALALLPDDHNNAFATIAAIHSSTLLDPNAVVSGLSDESDVNGPLLLLEPDSTIPGKLVSVTQGVKVTISNVSPVSDPSTIGSRNGGDAYNASWSAAVQAGSDWALLDSWNDYTRGTEVDATRQAGQHYEDLTTLNAQTWNGGQQWHVRYLATDIPKVISPDTITTVQVRLENAGTLPWRVGEDYSLSYRWYKDGRLYDDSSPKVAITNDVYPGNSVTLSAGIVAHDQYGAPLEPGDYTLVFDLVQGNDRWFTLAGDSALKTYVTVLKPGDPTTGGATFIASSLPTRIAAGITYDTAVTVRNDSTDTWKAGETAMHFEALPEGDSSSKPISGETLLQNDVDPGSIAVIKAHVNLPEPAGRFFEVKWSIHSPDVTGHLWQGIETVASDTSAEFVISDVPRVVKTGEIVDATLGVANAGPVDWVVGAESVGYHWAYIDGVPVQDAPEITTPIAKIVGKNVATAVQAKFKAPDAPGRYFLVWDVRNSDGSWASATGEKIVPAATLPLMVTVVEGQKSSAQLINITGQFNTNVVDAEGAPGGQMDTNGDSIPADQLPPDGTNDTSSNPLLVGLPGPTYYPSGFYSSLAGHETAFKFGPAKNGNCAIACDSEKIGLPDGFTTIHLLAASSTTAKSDQFIIDGKPQTVTVGSWSDPTATSNIGLKIPYHLANGVVDPSAPCVLYDIAISVPSGARSIVLPNDRDVKVFAVTVTR